MTTDVVIEVTGLTRCYGRDAVVRDLDFIVRRGEVYALLGRNGAGKTTALRMLLGLVEPTRGSARILGADCRDIPPGVRARLGYLAEGHHIYPWMRVRDLAAFTAGTHPRWDAARFRGFLEYFDLDDGKRIGTLSNGQRAQVALGAVLACAPEVLILDDPTLGVDPAVRRDFAQGMIDLVAREGTTVLLTTHTLVDVERVADRVGIIDGGILRADLPLDDLRRSIVRHRLIFEGPPPETRVPRAVERIATGPRELTVTVVRPDAETERALRASGAVEVSEVPMTLEEAFISFTATGRSGGKPW